MNLTANNSNARSVADSYKSYSNNNHHSKTNSANSYIFLKNNKSLFSTNIEHKNTRGSQNSPTDYPNGYPDLNIYINNNKDSIEKANGNVNNIHVHIHNHSHFNVTGNNISSTFESAENKEEENLDFLETPKKDSLLT
jgi:hypothetical protein